MRASALGLFLAVFTIGCTSTDLVGVAVDLGGRGDEIASFELRVDSGPCHVDFADFAGGSGEAPLIARSWTRAQDAPSLGAIPAGTVSISVLGRDASCAPRLAGCTQLDNRDDVLVRLEPVSLEPPGGSCGASRECADGLCVAESIDAGRDALVQDAGPPDAPLDSGPPDAPLDSGPPDAPLDTGPPDAALDTGPPDAPPTDAGPPPLPRDIAVIVDEMGNTCTAVVVAPRWAVAAGACVMEQDSHELTVGVAPTIELLLTNDGLTWGTGVGSRLAVERTFSVDASSVPSAVGSSEAASIALLRLAAVIPMDYVDTYPTLARLLPTAETLVSIAWRDCDGTPETARFEQDRTEWGTFVADERCRAAWGGSIRQSAPLTGLVALWSPGGAVSVPSAVRELQEIMATWDRVGAEDASVTRVCTHATAVRYWGDLDGDGAPDMICHDDRFHDGARWIRFNMNRVLTGNLFYLGGFCVADGDRLHIGDFDGDGGSDLLCWNELTGTGHIEHVSDGVYGTTTWTSPMGRSWCRAVDGELHLGDFDGDGRTDLLCRRGATLEIDRATPEGGFDLVVVAGDSIANDWCTDVTATVVSGDFDGDRRTDLACVRRAAGAIDLQFARADGALFSGAVDETNSGLPTTFCATRGDVLQAFDADGDGVSDLYCSRSHLSRDTSYRASRRGATGPRFVLVDDPTTDVDESRRFGVWGSVRPRRVHAASQPYRRPAVR